MTDVDTHISKGGEMHGDEYTIGQHAAKIEALDKAIHRIESSLSDHRLEEQEVWKEFKETLKNIKDELDTLRLWRSSVMGWAAAISTGLSLFWHAVLSKIVGPK